MLALLLAAALSGTTAQDVGAQAPFVYDRELGDIARKALRQAVTERAKPPLRSVLRVYVRCYRSRASFERIFERRFGVPAGQVIAYYAGGGDVHLRGGTCVGVRAFLAGRHSEITAAAFSVPRLAIVQKSAEALVTSASVFLSCAWLGPAASSAVAVTSAPRMNLLFIRNPRSPWHGADPLSTRPRPHLLGAGRTCA